MLFHFSLSVLSLQLGILLIRVHRGRGVEGDIPPLTKILLTPSTSASPPGKCWSLCSKSGTIFYIRTLHMYEFTVPSSDTVILQQLLLCALSGLFQGNKERNWNLFQLYDLIFFFLLRNALFYPSKSPSGRRKGGERLGERHIDEICHSPKFHHIHSSGWGTHTQFSVLLPLSSQTFKALLLLFHLKGPSLVCFSLWHTIRAGK